MASFHSTNIRFIELQEKHLNKFKKIHAACLPSAKYSEETYMQFLKGEVFRTHVFVNAEEQILSFIVLMIGIDACEIISIGTIKQYRNQGFASKMLNMCAEIYKPRDMFLEVETTNKIAINFYTDYGFEIINMRKKSNWGENSFLMKKSVENTTSEKDHNIQ
ncbi:MAG: GNAT family N-acetyltransferase [Holosporales bacterium]|jgi:ribosomal protein S18 acetylase RimI-like enzyme|nr:GNAT family N-acetyltransferase [Holosporales bacterium]